MRKNVITDKRLEKFARVAAARQKMTVIIENVHDPHNLGAVMRTCDSVGIQELFVIYTEGHLDEQRFDQVKSSATGVRKWLHLHFYRDVGACFAHVRTKYDEIWATHLGHDYKELYDLDLTKRVALLFGNEHAGLSTQALSHADGNFIIPQFGMVNSLNISVACAVTLYEAARQRQKLGMYEGQPDPEINQHFIDQHNKRYDRGH